MINVIDFLLTQLLVSQKYGVNASDKKLGWHGTFPLDGKDIWFPFVVTTAMIKLAELVIVCMRALVKPNPNRTDL